VIQTIRLSNGKEIEIPARIYLQKDLESMEIPFVEKSIFINKISREESFLAVSEEVKQSMAVLNYRDVSRTKFSIKALGKYVKEQLEASDSDFIIIPYFENETVYDVKTKN